VTEDWKTYRKSPTQEIKKGLPDEIHEFLTKVYNVYFIKLPQNLYKQFDIVRDKLIPLTVRFDENQYREFCDSFSKTFRSVIIDTSISEDVKKLVKELADKTNKFFESKGLPKCIEELRYAKLRVKVLYKDEPLEKAAVVAEASGKTAGSSITDKDGVAELDLPTGKYTVYVYKQLGEDEYVYEEKEVEVTRDMEIEFKIKESKTFTEIERTRHTRGPLIREVK